MKSLRICHECSPCRRFIRLLGIALVAVSSTRHARAIDPNRTMSQYIRERWGMEHGFPRGPVYSIDQTKDGYLWIGTEKGLVRFDGLSFYVIRSAAPQQPSLSHVLGLAAAADGTLWTRLRRPGLTLLRYDDGIFQNVMGDLATRSSVSAMTRGRDGTVLLWVLEQGRALVLRGKNLETVAALADFPRAAALAMAETADGEIWVGTQDEGLFRLAGGRTSAVTEGLPDLKVNALVPGGNNELWVGTDAGIVRWDGTKLTKAGVPRSLDGVQALAMAVDRDSNLWVGTNSQGLLRINSQGVAHMPESEGPSREAVTAVFEDREGNLWVGSASGLMRLRDSTFVTYSLPEGVPADGSSPVFVDSENRTWFSPAGGGLQWLKDGQHGRITVAGLDKEVIYSIAGRKDELWLGRQRGGLTHLRSEAGSFAAKTYTEADGLAQNSVYSVYLDRDGSVWAGTLSGGVSKLSGGRFTNYTIENGLTSNTVNSIFGSSDGTMWFATPGGLSALTKGEWRSYSTQDGLPSEDVNCLWEDSTGVLWVGTAAGLAFRGASRFHVPAGVPASLGEQILGITEDRYGLLWIATSNHVLRVNRDKLKRGGLIDGDLREYGTADGLRGAEGVKRNRSVVTDPAGRIWFSLNQGNFSGWQLYQPARVRSHSREPQKGHIQLCRS